ncbi:MAG TPA: hypothetical protein VM925_24490 [Labilithrix sp.]|nr:hypothetical protein [Labilithrix sp.]
MSSARTGRRWSSGGFRAFREDLVAWPVPPPAEGPSGDAALSGMSIEELRAELIRAKGELRVLQTRVDALTAENERLRRVHL